AERLRRHDAAVEIRAERRPLFGQRHAVAFKRRDAGEWGERLTWRPAHRHDAISVCAAPLGEEILPPEFLHWSLLGGQFEAFVLARETCERGQHPLLSAGVDLMDGKTQASVEMFFKGPRDNRDVVVGKCNG